MVRSHVKYCRTCSAPTEHEVSFTGLIESEQPIAMCDPCFGRAMDELGEKRKQFDALIAAGVDRETANKIMIARLEGNAPS